MNGKGRNRSVSDAEIIAVVKSHPDPAVKSQEVADEVGLSRVRVSELLNELESKGFVESKEFGSGLGWWVLRDPSAA